MRFERQSSDHTAIKLVTDGLLLAEFRDDLLLKRYDTIIIDEAHERSLNIDFLLGILKTILPRRPDLKVIVTSATINYEKFSEHFDHAPVIQVSGRTFPVEVQYQPIRDVDISKLDELGLPKPSINQSLICEQLIETSNAPWATSWSSCPVNARFAMCLTFCDKRLLIDWMSALIRPTWSERANADLSSDWAGDATHRSRNECR